VNLTKISEKIVDNSQISALNRRTKQRAIYFYYFTGGSYAVCASCMTGLRDVRIELMSAIRKHVIDYHDAIDGKYCSNCKNPQIKLRKLFFHAICTRFVHSKRQCCE